MARKSKSSENKDNLETPEETSPSEKEGVDLSVKSESTEAASDIIEAEAVEVTEPETAADPIDDVETTDSAPAEPEAEAATEAENVSDESANADVEVEPLEAEVPPASETVTETSETKSGTSVAALVIGGIVAGAIGFFGASFAPSPPAPDFDTSELDAGIVANSDAVAALGEEISALQSSPGAALSSVEDRLASITQSLEALSTGLTDVETSLSQATAALDAQVTALDDRILALETAVPSADALASGDELAALRERIAEMTAAAENQLATTQTEAASVARAAEEARLAAEAEAEELRAAAEAREAELQVMAARQAALIDLKAAIEAGAPFAEPLGALEEVPDVLAANAETGVPTILALQEGFPAAARAALAQSTLVGEDASAGERFAAFLRSRTNARSLSPRDGEDPDAILSRAEATLGEGDLRGALAELEALSGDGQAALAEWLEQANTRLAASEAVDQLSATN